MRKLGLVLLAAACGGHAVEAHVTPPGPGPAVGAPAAAAEAPRTGEYVVVSHATSFFTANREDAVSFRAQLQPPASDLAEDAAAGVVLHVLGTRIGWVEVDNPGADEVPGHCQGALFGLEPFHLHFFVRPHALAHVVTARYNQQYPDGTSIDLLPGLPLGPPDAHGRLRGLRPDVELELALPAGGFGLSYPAPTAQMISDFKVPVRGGNVPGDPPIESVIVQGAHLTVGPHQVVMRRPREVGPRSSPAGPLITLADQCMAVTALARPADVGSFGIGPDGDLGIGGLSGGGVSDQDTRYLYPHTAVFWADGSPAGEAREKRQYDLWHKHPTKPELACIVHDLADPLDELVPNQEPDKPRPPSPTELTLCFRYADTNYRN